MLTYAQNFEDVILARLFCEQQGGFYIDVGACHPQDLSVTKHFYDLGWSGINIEPIPHSYSLFEVHRPRDINLNIAIDVAAGEKKFFEAPEFDALSTFDDTQAAYLRSKGHALIEYAVPTLPLDKLFEDYVDRVVDFLKIDVEGSEDLVLQSIDLNKHRPRVLIIEAMQPAREFPGWGNHDQVANWAWEKLVLAKGYVFAYYDGISRFYVRLEDAGLLRRFELPPGCFDDIHRPEELLLTQALSIKADELKAAEQAIARLSQLVEHYSSLSLSEYCYNYLRRMKLRIRQLIRVRRNSLLMSLEGRSRHLPKITVVTPVYNCKEYLRQSIESVLRQEYPFVEYIVVDGGSTDGSLEIINEYRLRSDFNHRISKVISEPDNGMYDAISKGFLHCTGDILCYLNADDFYECGGLQSIGEYFSRHPHISVIYHEDVVQVDGWKYPNRRQPLKVSIIDMVNAHILFQDGLFWRRKAYEAVGGINKKFQLAGDFDLWLRLSAKYQFKRRTGHVSCFRIRAGQLSNNMTAYNDEVVISIREYLGSVSLFTRICLKLRCKLQKYVKYWRHPPHDRLYFSIDRGFPPISSSNNYLASLDVARSPIDGSPADRLLFTTPDTRFGDNDLNHIYLDEQHDIAITHPLISSDRLDELYRRNYSNPSDKIKHPIGNSPYRYFDGMAFWEKLFLKLPLNLLGWLSPNAWSDNTIREIYQILKSCGVNTHHQIRFLDTGCFEGNLLSQIKNKTDWCGFGIEPNHQAVSVACEKGHQVWECHAEDAVEILPPNIHFDVIYMGQSIEHVDNPVHVLSRLRLLLSPGGIIILSTPNLNSRQIDWFGPTWAHWHPPYHRFIFSRNGLESLARQVGLLPISFMSFSHPYWTTMSLAQNSLGLAGSASHSVNFGQKLGVRAQRIQFLNNLLWNFLGKGDYCFIALQDGSHD